MKIELRIAWILTVLLASLTFTIGYVQTCIPAASPLVIAQNQVAVPPLITTAQPQWRAVTRRAPWIGTVETQASVELIALVAGRVEAIAVDDQARIAQGKCVALLGGSQVESQRARLAAEAGSLKSQLDLARQTVGWLTARLKEQLATHDQVAATQAEEVRLETQLREARLNAETFEHQVWICAPISGIFTNRRVSVGQNVDAGQAIGQVIDSEHLRIKASLFPPQGMELQEKQAVVRLGESQLLTGVVSRVLPQDSATGAVMIWIEGPQINAHLRPGQSVEGEIVFKAGTETLTVPQSAIVYDAEEHPYLFVEKDGTYEPRSVRLGLVQDGWVEVLSGLEQNQSVVTQGAYELFYRQFNEQFKVQD
jgi:RND family efflux transporter MFP subunit